MIEQFKFELTNIEGLQLIHPFSSYDERGLFMKTYERKLFEEKGIFLNSAEDMVSVSHKGVLRGLHFQSKYSQDKLVRVLQGEVWDVAVDLRNNSDTYGKWQGFYLSAENKTSLYIPRGFAHGFLALSDECVFSYRCGQLYYPEYDTGIIWNDEDLQISWPIDRVDNIIISEKDKKLPAFKNYSKISIF